MKICAAGLSMYL